MLIFMRLVSILLSIFKNEDINRFSFMQDEEKELYLVDHSKNWSHNASFILNCIRVLFSFSWSAA